MIGKRETVEEVTPISDLKSPFRNALDQANCGNSFPSPKIPNFALPERTSRLPSREACLLSIASVKSLINSSRLSGRVTLDDFFPDLDDDVFLDAMIAKSRVF